MRGRRKFTPEFKAEAVEMVAAAGGGNIAQVAQELGIYDSTLGNWVRQARAEADGAQPPRSDPRSGSCAGSWSGPGGSGTSWQKAVAFFSGSPRISE
jgi:transposase-like protein